MVDHATYPRLSMYVCLNELAMVNLNGTLIHLLVIRHVLVLSIAVMRRTSTYETILIENTFTDLLSSVL